MMFQNLTISAALLLTAGFASKAEAARYVFTQLIVNGTSNAEPFAINDNDVVVGAVQGGSGGGFVWQNGAVSIVANTGSLTAINDKGIAAGTGLKRNSYALYNVKSGKLKTFALPVRSAIVAGINMSGLMAGNIVERHVHGNFAHAASISGRTYAIVAPQNDESLANAINDKGEIVGEDLSSRSAFTYLSGAYNSVNVPGANSNDSESLVAISNAGVAVGYYNAIEYSATGFTFDGSTYTNVVFPGAVGTFPTGFGSNGEIVGSFNSSDKTSHGFIEASGTFYQIDYPGASSTQIVGANTRGSLIGKFFIKTTSGYFVAQCSSANSCTH